MLQSPAPVELRREAARLLVEALPGRQETRPIVVAAIKAADDDEVRDWAAVAALRLGEASGRARLLASVRAAKPARDCDSTQRWPWPNPATARA
jgi:hypothetical protein